MNYYPHELIDQFDQQNFFFLEVEVKEKICFLTLDREEKKNAIHPQMLNELAYVFQYAMSQKDIWMLVLGAKGNVFCSGADLKAFMGMAGNHDSSIPKPEKEILIGPLFRELHKPLIAKVGGDVYAGGFFFLTGAHIVLAADHVKFGLPEVRRGLFPFQVMSELQQLMPKRKVLDWCIRGYVLPVDEAEELGLISQSCPADQLDQELEKILTELRANSPRAIQLGIEAYQEINRKDADHNYLRAMLGKAIASEDGQEGIRAFKEKRPPAWTGN